jgi:hypothetical protein
MVFQIIFVFKPQISKIVQGIFLQKKSTSTSAQSRQVCRVRQAAQQNKWAGSSDVLSVTANIFEAANHRTNIRNKTGSTCT